MTVQQRLLLQRVAQFVVDLKHVHAQNGGPESLDGKRACSWLPTRNRARLGPACGEAAGGGSASALAMFQICAGGLLGHGLPANVGGDTSL